MEVKVNGELIELGNSMPAISKKSIDINNPSQRFIDVTNKFQLPNTNGNREKFEHPYKIGSNSRAMNKAYDVTIFDVFQLFAGKGFVNGVEDRNISLQVQESSIDLFKALEVKLNQISWDDLDTELTTSEIDALDTIDNSNCWFWGKLCLHENALKINTDQTTGDARCKYSRPSLNVQALLKRAIENENYTYTASNVQIAISPWHENFFFTSYQKTFSSVNYNPSGTLAISGLGTNDFEHADLTVTSTTIAIGTAKTKFRLRGTITSDVIINLIIRATDDLDGTKVTESKLILGIGSQEVDFTSAEFQSDDGITVDIYLSGTGSVTINGLLYTLLSDKDFDLSTNFFLDYKIKVYDNLPDLSYIDLFKLLCVIGNQYQIVDARNKTFEFGSLANLNKLNAENWSSKFIRKSEKIVSSYPGLFQKNWLKYQNDLTVFKELGWSYFETDNESLQKEGDYIKINFGASNDVTINSNDISHIKIYSDTTRIIDQDISPRIFWMSGSTLSFENLKWTNLVQNYYENWFNCLSNIRLIDAQFNLSKLDVLKWNEKQMCSIDYFNSIFVILEINNFIPKRPTTCKILRYGR